MLISPAGVAYSEEEMERGHSATAMPRGFERWSAMGNVLAMHICSFMGLPNVIFKLGSFVLQIHRHYHQKFSGSVEGHFQEILLS